MSCFEDGSISSGRLAPRKLIRFCGYSLNLPGYLLFWRFNNLPKGIRRI